MWVFSQFVSYLKTAMLAMAVATLLFVSYGGIRTGDLPTSILWFAFYILICSLGALYWPIWTVERGADKELAGLGAAPTLKLTLKLKSDFEVLVETEQKRLSELIEELERTEQLERQHLIDTLEGLSKNLVQIEHKGSLRFLRKPGEKVGTGS